MYSHPVFDIETLYLYFCVGILCIVSVNIAKGREYSRDNYIKGFSLLFGTLFFFAVLRKVAPYIGGIDAINYERFFSGEVTYYTERFKHTDLLFGIFTKAIREVTEDKILYRAVCYGLIICGYIKFIKDICPQNVSPIPFICILVPYMRSFNTMRSSIAIALVLFSLVAYYNRKYIWCLLWMIAAVFMHRLSFAISPVFIFLYLYPKYFENLREKQYFIIIVAFIAASFILASFLQNYILVTKIFSDNGTSDQWYLTHNRGSNILENWTMYIVHIILLIAYFFKYYELPKNRATNFLLALFSFDLVMLPASMLLGLWRFQEYLYVPNLVLWSIILPLYYKNETTKTVILFRVFFFIGFTSLMLIRLTREYRSCGLMPYLFFWQ